MLKVFGCSIQNIVRQNKYANIYSVDSRSTNIRKQTIKRYLDIYKPRWNIRNQTSKQKEEAANKLKLKEKSTLTVYTVSVLFYLYSNTVFRNSLKESRMFQTMNKVFKWHCEFNTIQMYCHRLHCSFIPNISTYSEQKQHKSQTKDRFNAITPKNIIKNQWWNIILPLLLPFISLLAISGISFSVDHI